MAPVKNCPLRPSLQPLPSSPRGIARLYQYFESKELLHVFCSSSSLLSLMAFTLNCTQTENLRASSTLRVKANVCRCKVSAGQLLLSVQFFNCPFYFSPLWSNVAAPPSPCRWPDFICHHSPFHSTFHLASGHQTSCFYLSILRPLSCFKTPYFPCVFTGS